MEVFLQILTAIVGAFFIFLIYRSIKNQPEMFTKANLSKSFSTMGMLALILIGVVGLLIMLVQ